MALAPSVHIATHFGQGISCSRKKMFYLQAAAYRIEIPPASHFGRQITKKLKAERRFDTSVDSSNCCAKGSAFGSFATSSALTSAANSSIGRSLGCFSVFLRTHPSQTLFCTYHRSEERRVGKE